MITKQRVEYAFMAGLTLIAIGVVAYFLDLERAGIAFCFGLFICLASCLASILYGEKAHKEDVAVLIAGVLALSWLAMKNI